MVDQEGGDTLGFPMFPPFLQPLVMRNQNTEPEYSLGGRILCGCREQHPHHYAGNRNASYQCSHRKLSTGVSPVNPISPTVAIFVQTLRLGSIALQWVHLVPHASAHVVIASPM